MNALAIIDTERLAKVCGMFSSDHAGERAAAAAKADAIVRAAGLTWPDVLAPAHPGGTHFRTPPNAPPPLSPATILARHGDKLNGWERGFLTSLLRTPPHCWSAKQSDVLDGIRGRFQ